MARDHYMPLFVGDFLASTSTWSALETGVYLLLLMHSWSVGPLPKSKPILQRLGRVSGKQFAAIWARIGSKFVETPDGYVNARLEVIRVKSQEISETRSRIGRAGGIASRKAIAEAIGAANGQAKNQPSNLIQSKIKNKSASRARRAPTDFEPTEAMRAWAKDTVPDVDVDRETAAFRDHEFARAYTDWPSAWRNWLRKARPSSGANGAMPYQQQTRYAEAVAVFDRLDKSRGADPPRDARIQAAIDAAGGWLTIETRSSFDAQRIKRAFCEAYHKHGEGKT